MGASSNAARDESCGEASACVKTLDIPTSDTARHSDGLLTGVIGTLTATKVGRTVCLQLAMDDGDRISLVLPRGTTVTVHGSATPESGTPVTIVGHNG